MEKSLLIAGFGGQGIMLIGKMLGYAASDSGKETMFYPAYGAEMRGGTANCTVIISDEEIGSPMCDFFTTFIAMNEPSYHKFIEQVEKGGNVIINSSLVDSKVQNDAIKAYYVPANDIADRLGNSKVANIVMLGAYIAVSQAVEVDAIKKIITKTLGKKPEMLELNMKAFDEGYNTVK
jgi:2-oxoglutarate ferredoxin oxidoreductase subunit gamma